MKSVCCASDRRVITTLAGIGLCFAVVSANPAAAPAAPVGGACETTGTKVKVSTTEQQSASTAYVNVIESAIPFTQRRTGCVIISFSAEAGAWGGYTTMYVIAAVDGYSCTPYNNVFVSTMESESPLNARAMNFLCPDVAAGNHIVKMLFRGSNEGLRVYLGARTMIVHYAK